MLQLVELCLCQIIHKVFLSAFDGICLRMPGRQSAPASVIPIISREAGTPPFRSMGPASNGPIKPAASTDILTMLK